MNSITYNPPLGHITTFGGNPLCCAASLAVLNTLIKDEIINNVNTKEQLFIEKLKHPKIKSIRSKGLLIALEFDSAEYNKKIIRKCLNDGLIVDWFLFADNFMRIAPPLTISEEEIQLACNIILKNIIAQ
jgi:acetylornithine/succinyldiaminopimelate/putrescine aminotransferase